MPTAPIIPAGSLARLILRIGLVVCLAVWSGGLCSDIRCSGSLTRVETAICSNPDIVKLDQQLNAAYLGAAEAVSDSQKLRAEQLRWLNHERGRCDTPDCLDRVYRSRIAQLHDLQIKAYGALEKPLPDPEARAMCLALADVADQKRLSRLALPQPAQDVETLLTREERTTLKNSPGLIVSQPDTVYTLPLLPSQPPARFGLFSIGGSCAVLPIYNLDRLLATQGKDTGVEEVDDPEDEISGVYWGGGDYPILFHGRYFIVTVDLADSDRLNMVSWIKPDGGIRPLCLLEVQTTQRVVLEARDKDLCQSVASDALLPLDWLTVTEDLPIDHNPETYADVFVKRYGDYADRVDLLKVDIDGNGKAENIGRFEYASGGGCGSTHIWLRVLSGGLDKLVPGPMNDLLKQIADGPTQIYRHQNQYYIDSRQPRGRPSSLVRIRNRQIEQVCLFEERARRGMRRFFGSD